MWADCNKNLDKHESSCSDRRAKERHDFIEKRVVPLITEVHGKYEKVEDKVIKNTLENNSMKVQMTNIEKDVNELKNHVKDWFDEIKWFIKDLEWKFVTKWDFNNTKWTLNFLVKTVVTIATAIILWWWAFIWEQLTKNV